MDAIGGLRRALSLDEGSNMTNLQFAPDTLDRKGLLSALRSFKRGDFSVRLPSDLNGIDGEIAHAFNDVVEVNEKVTDEFARIRDEVGREGQINQRVRLPSATGSWADCVDSVNTLVGDLVRPSAAGGPGRGRARAPGRGPPRAAAGAPRPRPPAPRATARPPPSLFLYV